MPHLIDLPGQVAAKLQQYVERGSAELHYLRKVFESGALKLESPQLIATAVADGVRWGELGMIPALNARRAGNRTAIIDDEGELSFADLDDAANAVANGLLDMGVRGGDGVAILARNHRWFLTTTAAPASGPA
jgi:fatty-acyl-CoA synthase